MRNEKGQFIKGHSPWHKGQYASVTCLRCELVFLPKPGTAKKRKYCSLRCASLGNQKFLGHKLSKEHKDKLRLSRLGHPHSEETKKKISKSLTGKPSPLKGIKKPHMMGEKSPNWKGGLTTRNKIDRVRFHDTMQKAVFERDDYTCQMCDIRGVDLQVDHIQSWADYVEQRFNIDNCRTLCAKCHYKITFGKEMPKTVRTWGHNLQKVRVKS